MIKRIPLSFVALLLVVMAFLTVFGGEVWAEKSLFLKQLTERSWRGALDGRAITILEVHTLPGGAKARLEKLKKMLQSVPEGEPLFDDLYERKKSNKSIRISSLVNNSYLDVRGDGSQFKYRGNIDGLSDHTGRISSSGLDMANIAALGRAYLSGPLKPFVPLGRDENYVFLGTKYLRNGLFSLENQDMESWVVANIAIFGRQIEGTFITGAGSKIAIWFSNHGEPVGFDVDWPEYRLSGAKQSTLMINEVMDRFKKYAHSPLELISRNLTRFECGYVDLGISKRSNKVQTGCFAHHGGDLNGDAQYAAIDLVPIGIDVVVDTMWPITVEF